MLVGGSNSDHSSAPEGSQAVEDSYPPGILSRVLHESPEAVLLIDESFRAVYANRKGAGLFALTRGSSFHTAETRQDPLNEWCRKTVLAILEGRRTRCQGRFFRGDSEFHADCRRVKEGPDGSGLIMVRVRDRIRFRDNLKEEKAGSGYYGAEERLVSLGVMTRDAAHEWKNYITILSGHLQIIEMRLSNLGDASLVSRIDQVRNHFEQMSRSIIGMLEVSRREPVRTPCSINDLIESVIDFFSKHRKAERLKLDFVGGPEIPYLLLDAVQIEQVLINLLKNAAEAMEWEEGPIKIRSRYSAEDDFIEVTVADSGQGIPGAEMDGLFENSGSSKKDGHGIGLRLFRSIIREHGGSIQVESGEHGTVFRLRFPVPSGSAADGNNELFPRREIE